MDESKKKALIVKSKAVSRTFKQYKAYKQEVEAFNMALVSSDKKNKEFYDESVSTLERVKKSLIEFVIQFEAFLYDNQAAISQEDDPNVAAELQKGQETVDQVRTLFPAEL